MICCLLYTNSGGIANMKLTQKKVDKLFIKAVEDGNLTEVKYLLNESPIKANLHLKNEVEQTLIKIKKLI